MFRWVLKRLAEEGLLKGKTIGLDATTLEANATLKSIVRRDSGEGYQEYLKGLAEAEGIENPTAAELARFDRRRKQRRTSNGEWKNPHDEEARITKMKDGRTHFAYKAEHAVDMETGAMAAVVIASGDAGDTATMQETLPEAGLNTADLIGQSAAEKAVGPVAAVDPAGIQEVVADKGYHSDAVLEKLAEVGVRTYISEPDRGSRVWHGRVADRDRVYGNRRRVQGQRGRNLLRQRGELLERGFAHCYDTGGMRRVWLRGKANILKRVLIQAAAFNISLILRAALGAGTPRECSALFFGAVYAFQMLARTRWTPIGSMTELQPHSVTRSM
jgi:Transposase DDE domain